MRVSSAIAMACIGCMGGAVLRTVQLLFFFDFEKGFYKDGKGFFPWITIAFVFLCCIISMVMTGLDKETFSKPSRQPIRSQKSIPTATAAMLSGVGLIISAVIQYIDHLRLVEDSGADVIARQGAIFWLFLLMCALLAAVQFVVGAGFITGKHTVLKMPLIYTVSVIWAVIGVILVYVFYSKSANITENILPVMSSVLTMLCLMCLCKMFTLGANSKVLKRLYMWGIPAVIVTFSYAVGDFVTSLFERLPKNTVPFSVMLAPFSATLFLLIFMVNLRKFLRVKPVAPAPPPKKTPYTPPVAPMKDISLSSEVPLQKNVKTRYSEKGQDEKEQR